MPMAGPDMRTNRHLLPYRSDHAFFGKEALEEKYQITYTAADGSEKKSFFYLTFFDYQEPSSRQDLKLSNRRNRLLLSYSFYALCQFIRWRKRVIFHLYI